MSYGWIKAAFSSITFKMPGFPACRQAGLITFLSIRPSDPLWNKSGHEMIRWRNSTMA